MDATLTAEQKRLLTAIFERGAEDASLALSKWLGQPARLTVNAVDEVELADAAELLGPAEALVAACAVELTGLMSGRLILVFEDRSGLALADLLLNQAVGTAQIWGELEQSAAMETTNIVACAYLNSLVAHLPLSTAGPAGAERAAGLVPGPPSFRHEFAGSLLEFALMDQAMSLDRLLLVESRFTAEQLALDWSLLFVPSGDTLQALAAELSDHASR